MWRAQLLLSKLKFRGVRSWNEYETFSDLAIDEALDKLQTHDAKQLSRQTFTYIPRRARSFTDLTMGVVNAVASDLLRNKGLDVCVQRASQLAKRLESRAKRRVPYEVADAVRLVAAVARTLVDLERLAAGKRPVDLDAELSRLIALRTRWGKLRRHSTTRPVDIAATVARAVVVVKANDWGSKALAEKVSEYWKQPPAPVEGERVAWDDAPAGDPFET